MIDKVAFMSHYSILCIQRNIIVFFTLQVLKRPRLAFHHACFNEYPVTCTQPCSRSSRARDVLLSGRKAASSSMVGEEKSKNSPFLDWIGWMKRLGLLKYHGNMLQDTDGQEIRMRRFSRNGQSIQVSC